jgi:hypothetical protein
VQGRDKTTEEKTCVCWGGLAGGVGKKLKYSGAGLPVARRRQQDHTSWVLPEPFTSQEPGAQRRG